MIELTNATIWSSNSTESSILNLLNTNFHVFYFEISLKGFRSPLVVDLYATDFYAATCFHQFLIVDLVPVDACRVRRL